MSAWQGNTPVKHYSQESEETMLAKAQESLKQAAEKVSQKKLELGQSVQRKFTDYKDSQIPV